MNDELTRDYIKTQGDLEFLDNNNSWSAGVVRELRLSSILRNKLDCELAYNVINSMLMQHTCCQNHDCKQKKYEDLVFKLHQLAQML